MSSSKILFKTSKVVEIQTLKKNPTIEKYIGSDNYDKISIDTIKILENNIKKIMFINAKFDNKKYISFIVNSLFRIYELFFSQNMSEIVTKNDIKKRLNDFINISKKINNNNAYSIIGYHLKFLNNFNIYFTPLVDKQKSYLHTELYNISQTPIKENKTIVDKVTKYYEPYNINYIPKHIKNASKLTDEDIKIKNCLINIFNDVIKKLQKINGNNFQMLTYGSYTGYKINPEIVYNDIDFYHTDPIGFLSTYIVVVKIIMNIDINIFKIPFIIGHCSLRYKDEHFADCLYIDKETILNIPNSVINDIKFVHPVIQVVNNFRMMSEMRRISNFSESDEKRKNNNLKLISMLQYTCEEFGINFDRDVKKIDFDIELLDNSFVIDLKKIFKKVVGYEEIKEELEFDVLIVSRYSPNLLFSFLKKNQGIIRRQYFALFNEIVVEYYKNSISTKKNKSNKLNKRGEVYEVDIQKIDRPDNTVENGVEKIIANNNSILMSSLTEEFFLKVDKEVDGIIKTTKVTNITKETILSSFVLTQILKHKNNKDLVKFYFLTLLSFVFFNDKKNDLNDFVKNIGNIIALGKYKEKGNHEVFSLDPIRLKPVFFYKKQDKDVYQDVQEFLNVTSYNV